MPSSLLIRFPLVMVHFVFIGDHFTQLRPVWIRIDFSIKIDSPIFFIKQSKPKNVQLLKTIMMGKVFEESVLGLINCEFDGSNIQSTFLDDVYLQYV